MVLPLLQRNYFFNVLFTPLNDFYNPKKTRPLVYVVTSCPPLVQHQMKHIVRSSNLALHYIANFNLKIQKKENTILSFPIFTLPLPSLFDSP